MFCFFRCNGHRNTNDKNNKNQGCHQRRNHGSNCYDDRFVDEGFNGQYQNDYGFDNGFNQTNRNYQQYRNYQTNFNHETRRDCANNNKHDRNNGNCMCYPCELCIRPINDDDCYC